MGLDWTLAARNYADWSLSSSDIALDGTKVFETPWRIPTYSYFDLNASYSFKVGGVGAVLYGNINNIFNQEYIAEATDGDKHDWQTAYGVFYGFGRTFSVRLKINF